MKDFTRYHMEDEYSMMIETREGVVEIETGWLLISEEEYALLCKSEEELKDLIHPE